MEILPGQYFDAETGLHQNWFRDYDPTTGRYLQSDRIGLRGGLSTYGYGNQNPLRMTDRFGLSAEDYYAAEDLLRDISQQTGLYQVPPEHYEIGLTPLENYLGANGTTDVSWEPGPQRIRITDRYFDRCISNDEAKKLLETYVHELIHYNQGPLEEIVQVLFQDENQEYGVGNGWGDQIHDDATRRARMYADILSDRYNRLRKERLNGKCGCE